VFYLKSRLFYFLNNWVYTTNHKKIAVNYFWFVILSGVVGTVLATIIRLEMAYPGVGILSGDSLQYLSIVTAHGVIMVFFMIIPLLFGAFGNFLLPSQLGVHDVAFPRLNSAAFWFLPAGLIMLCQLVCIDKRYHKINCFNLSEAQSLLKKKFFIDLINNKDFNTDFNKSANLIKFSSNNLDFTTLRSKLGYNWNPSKSNGNRISILNSSEGLYFKSVKPTLLSTLTYFNIGNSNEFGVINSMVSPSLFVAYRGLTTSKFFSAPITFFIGYVGSTPSLIPKSLTIFVVPFSFLPESLAVIKAGTLPLLPNLGHLYILVSATTSRNPIQEYYNVGGLNFKDLGSVVLKSNDFLRFSNINYLKFKYDYKNGNYLTDTLVHQFSFLNLSKINISNNKRFNSWFFSDLYLSLSTKIGSPSKLGNDLTENLSFKNQHMDIFYSYILSTNASNISTKFLALNVLNQKFNKLFFSSSIQQRLYGNWRTLKFTREAWRTKLLIARHQKTLYNRYINENSVFWSIERNAKDLLPGWAMITPFSSRIRYTAIGKTDIGLFGVLLTLNASIISSSNFLLTYRYLSTLNNRKMRDARSFFSEAIMVTSLMMIAANPMLILAILMLLFDRHLKTSFFDYSGGGDTVLFQHMFWFFGHPEVYVIMLPVFGFTNTILSAFLRKRISARTSLIYSLYTIAFLGFFVWGHHMYMVGLAHTTRMLFSTLTVMISVPAATKLMHWSITLVNSSFHLELPLLFILVFIFLFISGGISGMCVAHTGMDILFHDTLYVIGHFHIMLSGAAMFGAFAAFYFYFPSIFGVKYSRLFAYFHFIYYLIGHLMTFIPLLWLGYAGMPRRVLDYPSVFGGWHAIASAGHMITLAGIISFFVMIFDSIRQSKNYIKNSYGIGRYNVRINFYLYEIYKLKFLKQKTWSFFRPANQIVNLEVYELTLISYSFIK